MQKRKIEDGKIWEAYTRIINGESLTKVAESEDINLNRGTLRRYIEAVVIPKLNETEKAKFEQAMHGNFRGNSTENKRKNRNKKKAISAEELSEQIKVLADLGVTGTQVESLYIILRGNKHTAYARDTFTLKCVEHFIFFSQIGVSAQDAFAMFMRNPKAFTSDTRVLQERYAYFLRKTKSREQAREALLSNPRGRNKDLAIDDYRKANDVAADNICIKPHKPVTRNLTNEPTDIERGED